MENRLFTFLLKIDWKLLNRLSEIDKFVGSWDFIEKREGQGLKQFRSIATVRSVGASTRIEGSKMSDDEVELLIKDLKVSRLEDRDEQEVAGYFEALQIISESFKNIDITESNIQNLHNILMKHNQKDEWHRGKYKQHKNVVEATQANGQKHVIFQTTDPGFATEEAMRKLVDWYNRDNETHTIIKSALFVYDFLSIHPFQDGNGRLSRLLTTLLLLRNNYLWINYISFEHEIESRKVEYYRELMECQKNRPGENVYPWINFFLDCLTNIQRLLIHKLQLTGNSAQMSPKEKKIYLFIEDHSGCRSGEIAERLGMPLPTIKRILSGMITRKMIYKHGVGKGTYYTID